MGLKELFGIGRAKTLFHPSCKLGKYNNPEIDDNYKKIFEKLGINFMSLDDKPFVCGSLALDLGYEKEFIKLARKNLKNLRVLGIKNIIVSCPDCYKTLIYDYKEFLLDWDIEVDLAIDLILKKLKGRRIQRDIGFDLTYHDNPYLGRYCGIYDVPREILHMLGHNLKELNYFREELIDCGSSGGLPESNPELSDEVALMRLKEAQSLGIKSLIVVGIRDYEHLKKSIISNKLPIEIYEISELVSHAIGIKRLEVVL